MSGKLLIPQADKFHTPRGWIVEPGPNSSKLLMPAGHDGLDPGNDDTKPPPSIPPQDTIPPMDCDYSYEAWDRDNTPPYYLIYRFYIFDFVGWHEEEDGTHTVGYQYDGDDKTVLYRNFTDYNTPNGKWKIESGEFTVSMGFEEGGSGNSWQQDGQAVPISPDGEAFFHDENNARQNDLQIYNTGKAGFFSYYKIEGAGENEINKTVRHDDTYQVVDDDFVEERWVDAEGLVELYLRCYDASSTYTGVIYYGKAIYYDTDDSDTYDDTEEIVFKVALDADYPSPPAPTIEGW